MRADDKRSTSEALPDHAKVVAWPPLLLAGFALAGALLHSRWPLPLAGTASTWPLVMGVAAASGALALWAARAMNAAGTNIRPDRPSTTIVARGPYRFTRNPMYVSLCLLQSALGLALSDLWPLLLVGPLAAALHWGVVKREEAYLERKFGEQYLSFKRRTRRWL